MCDPVTIGIALATTAAGTGLQMKAQNDAQDKINRLRANADAENTRLIEEAQSVQLNAAEQFDATVFQDNSEAQANQIEQRFVDNLSQGFTDFGGVNTPKIVQQAQAKESAKANEFSSNFAAALAKLRGFDQNLFNQGVNIDRAGQTTSLNSGFIQGNAAALNSDTAAVDVSSPFGDALVAFGGQALGSGFGTPAASGGGVPIPAKKPAIPARFS